ncbi:GGDEF domain-containing protein [Catenovulum agarivorans]|uniref:GGDEF domain-containing protein n=1 Tax=Catenovulum agarivorans TaxID=1172192 RepID=UPI0002F49233|nr:diguanylate cyclase [Catenovulum agarivorans]
MLSTQSSVATSTRDIEFLQRSISLILALTKQLDSLSLIDTLFLRLFRSRLVYHACMYEVHHKQGLEINQAADGKQLLFRQIVEKPWQAKDSNEPAQIVVESFLSQKPMTQAIEGKRTKYLIFPIVPSSGKVGHALELQAIDVRAVHNFLAGNVISVFTNLLKIFENMERDPLTGLYNKQCLEVSLIRYAQHALTCANDANRMDEKEWLAFIKITPKVDDNLEQLQILFGQQMLKTFRNTDLVFRFAENEFVVLLVCNEEQGVNSAVDRLTQVINSSDNEQLHTLTISMACAQFIDSASVKNTINNARLSLT